MSVSKITAGDTSNGLLLEWGNDGTLQILTGPNGSKVVAVNIDATGKVTFLANPALFSSRFVSADQTVTGNFVLNVAHGLGAKPSLVRVSLKCTTAELNYVVGDEVEANFLFSSGVSVNNVVSDATNVTIITNGSQPGVLNKTTQAVSNITLANWRWVVRAWL